MKEMLNGYTFIKDSILENFGIQEDFFIKVLDEYRWNIEEIEGMFFLNYWKDRNKIEKFVIVKKGDAPMISLKGGYTMIVAIDCIKIAIVLEDKYKE